MLKESDIGDHLHKGLLRLFERISFFLRAHEVLELILDCLNKRFT
jgi:hypothetical protein